jgi:hypothetical protein
MHFKQSDSRKLATNMQQPARFKADADLGGGKQAMAWEQRVSTTFDHLAASAPQWLVKN